METWAIREGTRDEIAEAARRLLADLREEGAKRPAVFVNGKRIK